MALELRRDGRCKREDLGIEAGSKSMEGQKTARYPDTS